MFPYHTNIIKGEQNTMKRKAVRTAYKEAAENIALIINGYRKGNITFRGMLYHLQDQLETEELYLYTMTNAGTITEEEQQLIKERLEIFTKKELKTACKV